MTLAALEILLVEDDAGDRLMTQEILAGRDVGASVHVATDGTEAMAFLRRRGRFADAPVPDLVLLDLNLPRKSGHEVLAEIRADAALTHLPVVIFTTSSAGEDVVESYRLHANAFVTKPSAYAGFAEVLTKIDDFYTSVARLP